MVSYNFFSRGKIYNILFCIRISTSNSNAILYFQQLETVNIDSAMDVDYYSPLAEETVPVAVSSTMLRPPPSYSVAVRSLSSPIVPDRTIGSNTSSIGNQNGRHNIPHHSNHHHR